MTLPKVIQPKQQASIKIAYDAKKKNQYGFFSDTIEWQSDDELQPLKSFLVHATIEEYFPPLSEIERPKAAKLILEQYSISMGRISSDAEQQREITLKNVGKKGLVIRALQPNCTCISASVSKSNIKPGEEGKLLITFNPKVELASRTNQ